MAPKIVMLATALALAGCLEGAPSSPPVPPLLKDARSSGGTMNLCEPERGGQGSTPQTAVHSPEIVQRLRRDFPPGTPVARLRDELQRQGFRLNGACSPDGRVSWAEFNQTGGNGITDLSAFATIHWRDDGQGKLVWATGYIAYRGL